MNIAWFSLALSSAISNSVVNAYFNYAVSLRRHSKFVLVFWYSLIASALLFAVLFFIGLPALDSRFWGAIAVTAVINALTGPMLLKAYELGSFSSVYSMILLTPVFSLLLSAAFIGELPRALGIFGVILTVFGLYIISKYQNKTEESSVSDFKNGNLLGISVALLWAVSTIFDKLATQYSSPVFAPAVGLTVIALANCAYAFFWKGENYKNFTQHRVAGDVWLLCGLGLLFALSNVLHNAALSFGFVAYTLAIKRMGILFGVIWGWLFFKENNISRKFFGAAVAVLGVVAILFA